MSESQSTEQKCRDATPPMIVLESCEENWWTRAMHCRPVSTPTQLTLESTYWSSDWSNNHWTSGEFRHIRHVAFGVWWWTPTQLIPESTYRFSDWNNYHWIPNEFRHMRRVTFLMWWWGNYSMSNKSEPSQVLRVCNGSFRDSSDPFENAPVSKGYLRQLKWHLTYGVRAITT